MKILVLLLAFASVAFGALSEVAPLTAYRLTFEAETEAADAQWIVEVRDVEGNLPYDGVWAWRWQQLTPGRNVYTHLFYTPATAKTVQLKASRSGVKFEKVSLERVDDANLVLNGTFSVDNFSGWSEHYHCTLIQEDGQTRLRVNQNGYALTDYIPVMGGGKYLFESKQGTPGAQVYLYDALRRYIGVADRKKGSKRLEVSDKAAYLRVHYGTGHQHLPTWRVNDVVSGSLVLEEPGTAPAPVPKVSTDYEIVMAPGCDPREEYAGRELQYWITAITGSAPALLGEPSGSNRQKIFVGKAWADRFSDDLKALEGSDGFAVRNKDGNIYVFAAHPRGTLYGVYALLERNTDIIWPRPNPEFAAFYSKTPKIDFKETDFLSRPTFADRYISGGEELTMRDWWARNGINSSWGLHKGNNYLFWLRGAQMSHRASYMRWLSEVREKDEKVLPIVDGQRVTSIWRQPCYTYPGTAAGIAARIKEQLKTLPDREIEHLHVTIADNWTVCGCPDCLAPIVLPNGETLTTSNSDATKNSLFFSTRNFMMLNRVAEEVVKEFPNVRIRTHAYIFCAEPPAVKVHPSIIPEFAAYPTQNVRYSIRSGNAKVFDGLNTKDVWKRRFETWGKEKKGELGYFGYYYPAGITAVADTAAEDFRDLASYHGVQVHTEGYGSDTSEPNEWDGDGMEKWVMARLMWNPAQDPEALRAEYIRRVYKGVESEMTEYYSLIRKAWHEAPSSVFVNCHTPASEIYENFMIKGGIEKRARGLLQQAESKAQDPAVKKLLQRQIAYFDVLAKSTNRISVPLVPELGTEWKEAASTHWEKAFPIQDFRKVDDWRSFNQKPADYPSKVRVARDQTHLYFWFEGRGAPVPPEKGNPAFPARDRFEVLLKGGNKEYYLTVGPAGETYTYPNLEVQTTATAGSDVWYAQLAIPLKGVAGEEGVKARVGRVYRMENGDREESSHNGYGIFNRHEPLWLNLQMQ